jgi:hypothetical protein
MFESQSRDPLAIAHVAHQPDKARDTADATIALDEPVELAPDIEIFALHADHLIST